MNNIDYAIGVDLGGTSVKAGIVNREGEIVKKASVDTKAYLGPEGVINQIYTGIKAVLDDFEDEIGGIGIGSPGCVNAEDGCVEHPPNLPGWERVYLAKLVEEKFSLPSYVENDANAASIGEMIYGAGREHPNFIMVTLGTGVGGGIVFNRKLFRGETGAAGELGHLSIDYNGNACNCGSKGCVEAYVGNKYLIEQVKEVLTFQNSILNDWMEDGEELTPRLISAAYSKDDVFAREVIRHTGRNLAYGIASAVNLLDISTIIIGGGVSGFGPFLFETIKKTMKERVMKSFRDRINVIPAALKNEAGIKGASALVHYRENA